MNVISFKKVSKTFRTGPRYYPSLRQLASTLTGGERLNYEDFYALKNVSFSIEKGETVGLIGRNGSGKSTTLKLISRVIKPQTGTIETQGKIAALLELGAGFHPELTGRENVFFNGVIFGNTWKYMEEKFDEIVDFSELGDKIDTPIKFYSSGMYARLGFAVAVFSNPEILLVDEVLSVGDESFQKKCIKKIESFCQDDHRTILFVSHNSDLVEQICNRVIWINQGKIVADGKPKEVIKEYRKQS